MGETSYNQWQMMSPAKRGWLTVFAGLGVVCVGAYAAALTTAGIAGLLLVLGLFLSAAIAFMASRDGHNALFGGLFLGLAPSAIAAGVDFARATGPSWLDDDLSFWFVAAIDVPPLTVVGLVIGLVAVVTRPGRQQPGG